MKFGYTIIYVDCVAHSLAFFEKAFRFKTRFIYDTCYAELETGESTLAFASHESGKANLPSGYVSVGSSPLPLGVTVALVTDNVEQAHEHAVKCGATSIEEPIFKPWGQTVSYLRCPDGTLVELCSPVTE